MEMERCEVAMSGFRSERGSVIVLVAVMIVLLVTCVALVIDIGHIHNVKIELQRAVDAAALAGAQELGRGGRTEAMIKTAAAGVGATNLVGGAAAPILESNVVLGRWVPEIIDSANTAPPPEGRFTAGGVTGLPNNAVRVTATLNVPHYFFFFVADTGVKADAIAVAKPIVPILPLAIVSCIPAGESVQNPGSLPGMEICDLATYKFNNDQNDTSAWTSLTFNVNVNQVSQYFDTETGRDRFNSVVFGHGLNNDGLENEDVDPAAKSYSPAYSGCQPLEYNINCGLGMVNGKEVATPAEFQAPSNSPPLTRNSLTGVFEAASATTYPNTFDPLTRYAKKGTLPRWYNLNAATTIDDDDHFFRVWSQDGLMQIGSSESFAAYQARLGSYYNGSVNPFGDTVSRFASAGGGMVKVATGNEKNLILQSLADHGITIGGSYSSIYWPDYNKIMRQAGYPKVFVFNGTAGSILSQFIDQEVDGAGDLRCTEDTSAISPLASGETALILKAPVVFAGACESWRALSLGNNQHSLVYIGMSKFLVTRLWKNPNGYDCGEDFVNATGCSLSPPPGGPGGLLSIAPLNTPGAIEGLIQFPSLENEEYASQSDVFLVE